TFYGGVNEIGGNKILIDDGETCIFLDFGKSFSLRGKYYDWIDKPRIVNGIGDLLSLGIVPQIPGIYRRDLLSLGGLWKDNEKDVAVDAIVLSHAHADHADYISLLREQIPVYMGEMTREIIETLEAERYSDIEFEITGFKERPIVPRSDNVIKRDVRTFKTGKSTGEFAIDSISIEAVHVDHSLPGCYGFIIRTSDATIVYSGDLRMHGSHPQLTEDFVLRAAEAKPDLMLCEGTRIEEPSSLSEGDIFDTFRFFIDQCKNSFVFADFAYKDIDRFETFIG
ncbi:MAG: MBL fold metallo-hydrolase, partial [Nitrososphaerales archaeon]